MSSIKIDAERALGTGVKVTFGEPSAEHTIILRARAFCEIQRVTGKNPLTPDFWTNLGPLEQTAIVWAGTLHEKHGKTFEEFADSIYIRDLASVFVALGEIFLQSSVDSEKKTEPEAASVPETAASTGSPSSPEA